MMKPEPIRPCPRSWRAALAMTLALAAALVACGGGGGASGSPPPPPTPGSRLAVSGTKLLDPAGHEVWMRGFNWGRWDTAQAEDGVGNTSRGATAAAGAGGMEP